MGVPHALSTDDHMRLALIGVGQAGGKIVDALLAYERRTRTKFVTAAVAVNTARADLLGVEEVPLERRVLIGASRVKGHGAGADNVLGAEIADEDVGEVMAALDDVPTSQVDAFLVVAGLGGGTGSGGAPVIARELSRVYEEPVYGLGALPSREEGGIYSLNAARSFQTLVRETDNLIVFDNDAWRASGETLQGGFAHINEEIARRLGVLFSAGEVGDGPTPESVVDASEIINTFACGGVSSIGYASTPVDRAGGGLLARLGARGDDLGDRDRTTPILTTVRKATLGRLTLPCETHSAERALVVVAGPPDHLDRRGIERAVKWLEEETGTSEVRGGDLPLPREDKIAAVVVLSGVTDAPRVLELQQAAVETQRTMNRLREEAPEALGKLIWTGDGELEPLF